MGKRTADITPEQAEQKRLNNFRRRVANMTPEQIERKRERERKRYYNRPTEEIEQDRARKQYANMTPEQIDRRRKSMREYMRRQRSVPERRKVLQERAAASVRKREANMTPEERDRRRERRWAYSLQKNYGLTVKEYATILARQKGRCAICERETDLEVDHCHSTNTVRGLLCSPCNLAVGILRNSITSVLNTAGYLLLPPALPDSEGCDLQSIANEYVKS